MPWSTNGSSRAVACLRADFPIDPNAGTYTHPLPPADLAKFNAVPGIDRIYDSGNIVIYDLMGSAYYGS